jgi:hypothetical protein
LISPWAPHDIPETLERGIFYTKVGCTEGILDLAVKIDRMFFIPLSDGFRRFQIGKSGTDYGFEPFLVIATVYLFTIEGIRCIHLALFLC